MDDRDFKENIEKIRDASDIVDVIGSYVQLKRRAGRFLGLCPFHNEKTPSFNVNPNRQSFHCFGCSAGGDVFSFIMKQENVDFIQAARFLAQRAGLSVELNPGHGANPEEAKLRDAITIALAKVARYYRDQLLHAPDAAPARDYLRERDLEAAVDPFDIGYSPFDFQRLADWARKENVPSPVLVKAGVIAKSERGSWYDRFSGRLLFAIKDEMNQIVGFSGRLLPGDDRQAKYVNSPETPVFRKSRLVYGLWLAKKPILERQNALLCEGQIDVIRCHLAGYPHAIAAQGTAITEDHARVLKRCADSVTLVLDGDAAGQKAALRSMNTLIAAGLAVNIAALPEGDDPDTLLRRAGPASLTPYLDQAKPALDFLIHTMLPDPKAASDADLLRASAAALETISLAPTAIYQDQLLRRAAENLGLDEQALRHDLFNKISRASARPATPRNIDPAPSREALAPEERELLFLMIHHPPCIDLVAQYIREEHLANPEARILYTRLLAHPGEEDWQLMPELSEDPEPVKQLAAELLNQDRSLDTSEVPPSQSAQALILAIRRKRMNERLNELKILRGEATGGRHQDLDLEVKTLIHDILALKSGWDHARDILDLHHPTDSFSPQ